MPFLPLRFSMFVDSSTMDVLVTYPYHLLALFCLGCMLSTWFKEGKTPGLPLPPGPKGYPLIGNLLDIPLKKPWLVYQEWCKTYGDMIYFNVLGQHFLVLGSSRRTADLFEKRSSNYSDRRRMPMVMDLMKWDFATPFRAYDLGWRKQRKIFHEYFQVNAVSNYLPIQERAVHKFLRRLLYTSHDFLHHIRHVSATIIMKISYGIDVQETDDPYVALAEDALHGINQAAILGNFWVDLFPILQYVPSWLPGAGFQKKAAHWRNVNAALSEKPFRYVKAQLQQGTAVQSVAASLIERLPHENDPRRSMEERIAREVTTVSYLATTDTATSTIQAFFLAMALYPDVQKKAQAEIDAVIGRDRLPNFQDRPSLPFINAVVKESLRWHVAAPLGIPHMATNDDEYDGYYIPKGTVVIGNAWSILHDPGSFINPMEYKPERYLKDGILNPDMNTNSAVFGFGRRICPGRHLADNLLYSIVSCVLAVYDIKPPVDDKGNIIKLEAEFTSEPLSYPVPFKCIIKPRTPAAESLIQDSINQDD